MNEDQIKQMIEGAIDNRENFNAFNPSLIAYHTHNGIDSVQIPFNGMLGITKLSRSTTLSREVVVLVDATSAAITLTLPSAVGNDGRQFIIKDWKGKASIHNITMQPSLSQTIDGSATKVINANYASFYVISNGVNWSVL